MKITIKDLLKEKTISGFDITDDYDESLYIAYEPSQGLTKAGKDYFKDILDLEVTINIKGGTLIVNVAHLYDNWIEPKEGTEEYDNLINRNGEIAHPLHWKVYDLFEGLAGYRSVDDSRKWFKGEW